MPIYILRAFSYFPLDFPPSFFPNRHRMPSRNSKPIPPPSSDHQPLLLPLRQRQEMVFPISTHAHLFLHERKKNQTFLSGNLTRTSYGRIFMHLSDLKNMEYVKRKFFLFPLHPLGKREGEGRGGMIMVGRQKHSFSQLPFSLSICLFPSPGGGVRIHRSMAE